MTEGERTIAAISTANGRGGVAVIRISGAGALSIARQMFTPRQKGVRAGEFEPYRLYPGDIQAEHFKDFGMCAYFKAPKSYTGEDVIEFHCHGGTEIAQGILKQTYRLGASPAEAGEFTKRAFLNGKMTLSAAEGVADMINADSESMIKAGYSLLQNDLGKRVVRLQNKIKHLLASIEVDMDYPEEELDRSLPDLTGISDILSGLISELDGLLRSYTAAGRTVNKGITVAIVGSPNSGKSSLLNAILGQNKAIVSDIEGTTRDVVEGTIHLNGILFRLYDTAGIRESKDVIERIGVEKAEEILSSADVVLHVVDGSKQLQSADVLLHEKISQKERFLSLTVVNKSDLQSAFVPPNEGTEWNILPLSAKSGEVDCLTDSLYNSVKDRYTFDHNFVVEERHYNALKAGRELLEKARLAVEAGVPSELLTVDLSECWQRLGEITGETANEEIITEIFSKFCVGK